MEEEEEEEETRCPFSVKRPFFSFFFSNWRNDTPTHEQSSDIIVAKSKGFFISSFHHDFPFRLFCLITRIYEFLSLEKMTWQNEFPDYTTPDPWAQDTFVLVHQHGRGKEDGGKNGGRRLKIRVQEEIAWKLSSWEARSKDTAASRGLASTFRRLSVRFSDYSPSSSHPRSSHPPLSRSNPPSAFHPLVAQLFSVEAL